MKQYFIAILLGLTMGCTTPNIYGPSKQEQDLAKLLDSTPTQATDFVKAPVKDIITYLSSQSALHSPNNKSVTFVFPYEEDLQQIVTARLPNSSLSDAIRTLCRTNALRYRIDENAVYISGFYDEPGPLSIRSYNIPRTVVQKHISDNPSPENLIKQLSKYGVPFPYPDRVFAAYNSESQVLTVGNTEDALNILGSVIDALMKTESKGQ